MPPPPVPAVRPQCKGNDLALDTAFNDFACLGTNTGAPELRVVLTASPAEVAPGGKVEITATFTNDTDAPVAWGMTILPGWDLFPLATKNVSATYPCERGPSSNTPAPMVVVIDAHGSGHVKRTWVASRSAGACGSGVPLEPGMYEVGLSSSFAQVRPASVRVVK